jgi:uncharacterized lipoprotein YajG
MKPQEGTTMKNTITMIVALALLAGCTTPKTVLKNPKTGQVQVCGGNVTSSLVGGVIGYQMQKANDTECARDYMEQGFKRIDNQQ